MSNPLEEYRRAQRAVRKEFDSFTRAHCPTCPSPCCVRPARIAPTDILLAEAAGWRARLQTPQADLAAQTAASQLDALTGEVHADEGLPCEHLGPGGCTFPPDLRPFGCTAYICPIMYERLDRKALGRIKRLVRELERRHETLLSALHR